VGWLLRRLSVSRLVIIVVSVVVGLVLAVGATFATGALATRTPTPSNQAPYEYGG
jgi:NADH:ubiquinone oxidoreductase subunit 3 (subunit A)